MNSIINDIEKVDLTGEDLVRICKGKVKVVPYHELKNYDSIEDLLKEFGAIILLYETKLDFGHYTALHYDNTGRLEFFDSYGLAPDAELKYAAYNLAQGVPYLTNLLKQYKKPINYNKVRLQKFMKDINTCGRWTSCRIRMNEYPLADFIKLMKDDMKHNGDWYVSALTYLYTLKD